MNRIQTLEPENAPQEIAALYSAVQKKLGLVPNMVKALGNSEAALQAYLGLSGALSAGKLRASTREKIALLVAETSDCGYCLSAHTAIGGSLKIAPEEIMEARRGQSPDAREQAILNLVQSILETRGDVPEAIYAEARAAGLTAGEAAEVVANIAVNLFTNFFNRLAQTTVDFPPVEPCAYHA